MKHTDRLPSYCPAFDEMKQLQKLSCPIIAMSAILTAEQIALLQQDYMHGESIVILTKGIHRKNLKLQVQRYKRHKQVFIANDTIYSDENESVSMTSSASLWEVTMHKIKPIMESHLTVVYLDFMKDVEEVTEILCHNNFRVGKYTGQMTGSKQIVIFYWVNYPH